jgi:ABC-type dipeptide/oligopeptide/nickel transport system permease subunit
MIETRPPLPGPEQQPGRGPRLASALLPGLGHVLTGRVARGCELLVAWLALVAAAFFARHRMALVPRTGSFDDWLALITLVAALVALWTYALRDAARVRTAADVGISQWQIAMRHFRRNRPALIGLWAIVLLAAATLLTPLLTPWDPYAQTDIVRTRFQPPTLMHWLGTDGFGRDILTRLLYGARVSLTIGFVATGISITLGTLLGAVAGYAGGRLDTLLMRFTDMVLSFPRLVLLILIVALFGSSVPIIIVVLGLTQWPSTTRIVRGDVLSLREREFIQAARALGFGRARIVLQHLVPNVLAPVIVSATLGIGNTIVLEAGLSFLGLGPPPPLPAWGSMVTEGADRLVEAWWVATFPGLTIVLVVLAFNLLGDGLRDALDPRLR